MDNNIDNEINSSINNDLDSEFFETEVISPKKRNTSSNRRVKKNVNKNTNGNGNTGVVLIVSILLSFVCGAIGAYLIVSNFNVQQSVVKNITTSELVETSISMSVDKVYPATVFIVTYENDQESSTGTGFVYKKENGKAYIMTNNHVIDGATSIEIEFNDSSERIKAEKVGGDEYQDIAVLTIDEDEVSDVVEIGKTSDLKLGDTIFTVGSPLGINYKGTVTKGIVSGKDRVIEVSLNDSGSVDYYMNVLQVDAALNPGNSGGPLCDVSGKVVGVTALKIIEIPKSTNIFGQTENLGVESMGFAIPIEDALRYASQIEEYGEVIRPYIGVSVIDVSNQSATRQYGVTVPNGVSTGVAIIDIEDGNSASVAGFEKGDILVKLDDNKIDGLADFKYELYKYEVGDKVEVTYYRNGKEETRTITLGKNK